MKLIETFKPDLFHTLCDGDTNASSGNKRMYNAMCRTENFFNVCASLYKTSASVAESMLIGELLIHRKSHQIFKKFNKFFDEIIYKIPAPIEGGYSIQYREATIQRLNAYENQEIIGGYFLDGFHSNGDSAHQVDSNKVCEIVAKCNAQLPTNKLKVMLGAYSPTLVIRLIQLGVDLFDTTYAYLITSANQALTFNFDVNANHDSPFAIDLSDSM